MANGIVTPPDYRAAEGIKGFVGGLQAGVGIARDVQGIKQNKVAAERKKVTDAREDTEWGQSQEDRKNKAYQEFLDRQEQMMTGYTRAIRVNPEAAMDIRESMLTAGGSKKKLREPPTFVDVDGGFEIHEKYDDGTEQVIPADYVKDAYNKWPSKTQGTVNPDDKARMAMEALDKLDKQIDSLQADLKDSSLLTKDKAAIREQIKTLRKRRPGLEKQVEALGGVSMGKDEEPAADVDPKLGTGVPSEVVQPATEKPGLWKRVKNVVTGELGGPDQPAPVATTGPSASAAPAIAQPKTQAEFDALPSGAKYINPKDGKTYTKK